VLTQLPANQPLAWAAIAAAVIIGLFPLITARVKKPDSQVIVHPPQPTPQQQIAAGNELLATLVADLQRRADHYVQENSDLRERLGQAEAQIVALSKQVEVLQARLMERERAR